jgi:CRP-like cAMP-binding protein
LIDSFAGVTDLVIALALAAQFETVEGALAGQRLIPFPLATEHGEERIMAQLLVIVQILIAKSQPKEALRQHRRQRMFDPVSSPLVGETVGQPTQQLDLAIRLTQQQRAAVAAHLAATKSSLDAGRQMDCK